MPAYSTAPLLAEIEVRALAIADRLSQRATPSRGDRDGERHDARVLPGGAHRGGLRRRASRARCRSRRRRRPTAWPPRRRARAAATSRASAGVTIGRSSSSPSALEQRRRAVAPHRASVAGVAARDRVGRRRRRSRAGRRAPARARRAVAKRASSGVVCADVAGPARDELQAGGQRGARAPRGRRRRARTSTTPPCTAAATSAPLPWPSWKTRVRGERGARAASRARRRRREQRGRRRDERRGAAPEPELALADQEGARVDDDAPRSPPARAAARSAASTAPASPPGTAVRRVGRPVACALRPATRRRAAVARRRLEPRRSAWRSTAATSAGRAAQHGVLAGEEELARARAPRTDRHASTSAPRAGRAREHALDARARRPSAPAIRGASAGAQSTFTCGPASIVTNAGDAVGAQRPHAVDALDRGAAPVEQRRPRRQPDGVHLERAVLGEQCRARRDRALRIAARASARSAVGAGDPRGIERRRRGARHAVARRHRLRRRAA